MAREISKDDVYGTTTDANAEVRQPLLSVVGSSASLQGKFEITDSICIECEVGGELKVGRRLVIGGNGVVHADVHTVDAVVQGTYEGNMIATGNVEITETGRVTGNIQTDSLVINKGGFFNGHVEKIGASSPVAARPSRQHLAEERRIVAVR